MYTLDYCRTCRATTLHWDGECDPCTVKLAKQILAKLEELRLQHPEVNTD